MTGGAAGAERALGATIAALGNPAEPGFWLRTPLVDAPGPGRVVTEAGTSAQVDLIPSGGEAGSGSEASLALLRVLDRPLTDLTPLDVFAAR